MTVRANDKISKVNLIRVGADTHDFNSEQRLIPVPFTQSGTQITATLSASAHLAPPGYYMLFVFNTAGVPAVAKIISIGPSPDLIPTSLSYNSTFGLFTVVVKNQGTAATPAGVDHWQFLLCRWHARYLGNRSRPACSRCIGHH